MSTLYYKILEFTRLNRIGRGAFSAVYRCVDPATGSLYAMKVIDKGGTNAQGNIDMVTNEIRSLQLLSHQNIVRMHCHYEDDHSFYLIEELCGGGGLDTFLQANTVSEGTARMLFAQIASAVCYMHRMNYAHKDLKPENILFTSFPNLKICDFAFCDVGVNEQGNVKKSMGTILYCSPECIMNREIDSRKSDIWSLGVILLQMISGKLPWEQKNQSLMIRQIIKAKYKMPNCSNSLQSLIREMLRVNPDERITAEEILEHDWLKNIN